MKKVLLCFFTVLLINTVVVKGQIFGKRHHNPFPTALPDSSLINGSYKKLFSYDNEGNIVITEERDRTVMIYDSEGRLTKITTYDYWYNPITGFKSEYTHTYYKGDRLKETTYCEWGFTGIPYLSKTTFEYDSEGNITSAKENSDDHGEFDIKVVDRTIENDGTVSYTMHRKPLNTPDSEYQNYKLLKEKYNINNILTYTECHNYEWDEFYSASYDNEGKPLIEIQNYSDIPDDSYIDTYVYNKEGNLSEIIREDGYSTKYYYSSDGSGIKSSEVLNSKVYWKNGVLTVDSEKAEKVSVFSVDGVLLYSFEKSEGEVSVSLNDLSYTGIIIVKGSTGWFSKVSVN